MRCSSLAGSALALLALTSLGGYIYSLQRQVLLPRRRGLDLDQANAFSTLNCSQWERGRDGFKDIRLGSRDGSGDEASEADPESEAVPGGEGRRQARRVSSQSASGPRIIGSRLQSAEEVLLFRGRWDCMTSHHGTWVLNSTPRPLPVRDEVQEVPKNQICRKQINNSDLAPLNARVRQGHVAEADWDVPTSLKYEWRVVPQGSCGVATSPLAAADGGLKPFDGRDMCTAFEKLRRGRGLSSTQPLEVFVVGDSLSAAFMSSWEAQMKLTFGPKGVVQVAPTGICANYTRNVNMLHPQYSNADEQWYEHKHYLWHGTHCAGLRMCHVAADVAQGGQEWPEDDEPRGGGRSASPGVMLRFGRTMHLSWLTASEEAEKMFLEEPWEKLPYPWAEEMIQRNASVAVLNTGAFHQPQSIFLKRLNFTLRLLREKLPHLLIVYRSTSSAHLQCMAFKAPLTIPRSICGAPYHWGEFATQNKLARRIVEDVGGVWLDVFSMTELRPDWHLHAGDCLHYCAPGPIDAWVQLLMNMLLELA